MLYMMRLRPRLVTPRDTKNHYHWLFFLLSLEFEACDIGIDIQGTPVDAKTLGWH